MSKKRNNYNKKRGKKEMVNCKQCKFYDMDEDGNGTAGCLEPFEHDDNAEIRLIWQTEVKCNAFHQKTTEEITKC